MQARCEVSYVISLHNSPPVCYRLSKILYNDTAFFRRNLTATPQWGINLTFYLKKSIFLHVFYKLGENQRDQSKTGSQRGIYVTYI
jgi:hypothetical protein